MACDFAIETSAFIARSRVEAIAILDNLSFNQTETARLAKDLGTWATQAIKAFRVDGIEVPEFVRAVHLSLH